MHCNAGRRTAIPLTLSLSLSLSISFFLFSSGSLTGLLLFCIFMIMLPWMHYSCKNFQPIIWTQELQKNNLVYYKGTELCINSLCARVRACVCAHGCMACWDKFLSLRRSPHMIVGVSRRQWALSGSWAGLWLRLALLNVKGINALGLFVCVWVCVYVYVTPSPPQDKSSPELMDTYELCYSI